MPRIIRFPFGGRGRLKGGSPWLPLQAPVHAFSRELKLKRARVATYATYAAAHSMRRAVRSVPHAVGIPVLLLPPPLHMLRSWCSILLVVEVGTTAMQIKAVCHLHTRSWRRGPPARRSGGGPAEEGPGEQPHGGTVPALLRYQGGTAASFISTLLCSADSAEAR